MKNYNDLFTELTLNQGFTCSWDQLGSVDKRYIVGITDNRCDAPKNARELRSLLAKVLEQKAYKKYIGDSNYCFGCWQASPEIVSVDINLCTDDLTTAITTGFDNGQDCIYDQESKILIWLPKQQKAGTETQKSDYKIKVRQFLTEGNYITEFSNDKLTIIPIWTN
jgi:hypothetical protein